MQHLSSFPVAPAPTCETFRSRPSLSSPPTTFSPTEFKLKSNKKLKPSRARQPFTMRVPAAAPPASPCCWMREPRPTQWIFSVAQRCTWRAGACDGAAPARPRLHSSTFGCSDGSLFDKHAAASCALLLIERGCDFNLRDNFKCTALHRAAGRRRMIILPAQISNADDYFTRKSVTQPPQPIPIKASWSAWSR